MKACYFDGDNGEIVREEEIPANLIDRCNEKKLELLSCLAECGEEQMEEYYLDEQINVPVEELKDCIRRNTLNLNFCPVFLGSAYKNKGV